MTTLPSAVVGRNLTFIAPPAMSISDDVIASTAAVRTIASRADAACSQLTSELQLRRNAKSRVVTVLSIADDRHPACLSPQAFLSSRLRRESPFMVLMMTHLPE
jgi:hypothetical protein